MVAGGRVLFAEHVAARAQNGDSQRILFGICFVLDAGPEIYFDETGLLSEAHPPYLVTVVPSSAVKSTEPVPPNSFGEATVLQPTRPPMMTDASDKMNACDAMSFYIL